MQMTSDSHPVDNPDASKTGPALPPQPHVMAELGAFISHWKTLSVAKLLLPWLESVQAQGQPCMDPAGHWAGAGHQPSPKTAPWHHCWGDRTCPPAALSPV